MVLTLGRWRIVGMCVVAVVAAFAGSASAQPPEDLRIRYNSGQAVVPVFEGWQRNPNGTFDMVFGYLNRNYVEEVIIPVGPDNRFEPYGPDQGQPAFFYPRRHYFVFRLTVPEDWGDKELVWTLTAHGKTATAYGSLMARWEIDPLVEIQNAGGGGPATGEGARTQPPRVTIDPVLLPAPTLALTHVKDGSPPTFTKDVAPILYRSCQTCHRSGTSAPMSLLTYEDARPWARSIRAKVASREMPPWHIVRNVGIQSYKDDPSLTDDEIATITEWVDAGAPRGDPADLPPPRDFPDADAWQIGEPDLIVTAPPHEVPAAGADWWGAVTVPSGLTEDRYIKAVELKPGSRATARAVHHILAYAEHEAYFTPGDKDFAFGRFVAEYSLGESAEHLAEGSGRLLRGGSKIRFELHYHAIGDQMTDASQIGFVFYPKGYVPERIQETLAMGHGGEYDVPGGASWVRSDGYTRMNSAGVLTGFQPHMHARGRAQCLELIYPTGGMDDQVEQIACANFEFGEVMVYNWAEDVRPIYPAGTLVHVINWHDNSANNRTNPDPKNWVGNGNRSIDEMGFSWINYYKLTDEEYAEMLEARKTAQRESGFIAPEDHPSMRGWTSLPTNVPLYTPSRPPAGMSVAVIVYRGPAAADFDPEGYTNVTDDHVTVKAIFSQPGTYVLRVIASDGMLRTASNVTITVGDVSGGSAAER